MRSSARQIAQTTSRRAVFPDGLDARIARGRRGIELACADNLMVGRL